MADRSGVVRICEAPSRSEPKHMPMSAALDNKITQSRDRLRSLPFWMIQGGDQKFRHRVWDR